MVKGLAYSRARDLRPSNRRSSAQRALGSSNPRALFSQQFPDLRADGGGGFALLVLMGGDDVHEGAADDHAVGDLGDGLDVGGGRDAEADALASLKLLHILAGLNDLLPLITPATLHEAQQCWWVQQQDAAEARALGSGTAFERQDCWPLIPFTDGAES